MSWKESALVWSEILTLFVNTLTAHNITSIPVAMYTISRNKFKRHYFKNKRLFVDFLLRFLNLHAIYNILRKKMSILA